MLGIGAAILLLMRNTASAAVRVQPETDKGGFAPEPPSVKPGFSPVRPNLPRRQRLTKDQAIQLASWLNANEFGGWFNRDGRRTSDVVAIFQIESNFDPEAIGDLHLPDKSWGIGQVRGTTAADRGVSDPRALLEPTTGALISMAQLQWSWNFLASRMGRNPTIREWIGSYNAGVGSILKGRFPESYYQKWRLAARR